MISVLFVEKNSVYKKLPVDCWDADRDARNFAGDDPVICHPPCRLWSKMHRFSTAPSAEKELAIFAANLVRRNGGILEHPAASGLWKVPGITAGAFLLSVNQHWWGHPCEKKTILLISGITMKDVPPVPLNFSCPPKVIAPSKNQVATGRHLPKSQRNKTPEAFARWLIDLARLIEVSRQKESKIDRSGKVSDATNNPDWH